MRGPDIKETDAIDPVNILVADDEAHIRQILGQMLESEGFTVFTAENGEEAVRLAREHALQLAILDIYMPRKNGLEALGEIKRIDPTIEVLIITGNANLESLRTSIVENGAFDYLLKPFFRKELLHTVKNALMKRAFVLEEQAPKPGTRERIARLEENFEARTRQLRESQIKYKEIVENSGDTIFVVQEGRLKYFNTNMLGLTGYTAEELRDMELKLFLFSEDRDLVLYSFDKVLEQEHRTQATCRFRIRRRDGSPVWVEAGNKRSFWDESPAVLSFCRDITERKKAEEALRRAHHELEQRVTQRTAELTEANQRLTREINERKEIELNLKQLLRKQEINVDLAKRILNMINGTPPRYVDLNGGSALFVEAISLPCAMEGGDHYFVRTFPEGGGKGRAKTVVSIKDQSGHSVNCILRSIATDLINQSLLHRYRDIPPDCVLTLLNELVGRSKLFSVEDFVTAFTAEIDHRSMVMRFVSNGHPPLLIIRDGRVRLFPDMDGPGTNTPIAWETSGPFHAAEYPLREGDKLIFYTDGLNEMPHHHCDRVMEFEDLRILVHDLICQAPEPRVSEILHQLLTSMSIISQIEAFPGRNNLCCDDITILGVELERRRYDEELVLRPRNFQETAEAISDLYRRISVQWDDRGFEAPEYRLYLVLEETVWNAWKHGNRKSPDKTITVRWRFGNDFVIEVIDQGEGFDHGEIPDPLTKENLTRPDGRGVFLVSHFATAIDWEDEGRRVRVCLPKRSENPFQKAAAIRPFDLWKAVF